MRVVSPGQHSPIVPKRQAVCHSRTDRCDIGKVKPVWGSYNSHPIGNGSILFQSEIVICAGGHSYNIVYRQSKVELAVPIVPPTNNCAITLERDAMMPSRR